MAFLEENLESIEGNRFGMKLLKKEYVFLDI